MKLTDHINSSVHPWFVRYVLRAYRKKIKRVEQEHPELFKSVSADLVQKHKELWERVGLPCSDRWLLLHVNLTGIQDYRFCPEDIFFARIERVLCPSEMAGRCIEDKNFLNSFLDKNLLPETLIRYMQGSFFNNDYNWISEEDVDRTLRQNHGELVVKPCIASSGGHGVELVRFDNGEYLLNGVALTAACIKHVGGLSYALQKRIKSDPFSSSFNPPSANTCRMMTLRCPWDGKVVVLKTMMRLGVADAVVDNMMKGGLCVNIGADGCFSKYGYDYNGARHICHPGSGIKFEGLQHPFYRKMEHLAISVATRIPYYHLLSFDLIPDVNEQIKIVEINATSQGITQMQYDHGGLFGEHTEKVVDWCVNHLEFDEFKHFRTFY